MGSTFPNQIDEIPKFLDVTQKDGALLKEFEKYMQANDLTRANQVLKNIDNADQKIISAERMNKLRDCIIALENFYKTDIEQYTNQKQSEWQGIIDRFQFKGSYSSSVPYEVNNFVLHQEKGEYNLYIKTNGIKESNIPPNDTRYWRKLTVTGEKGDSPVGETVFMFEWLSSQPYEVNEIVSHNNKWWICLKPNTNSEPLDGNLNWRVVMESLQANYPIQKQMPVSQAKGELWFEVM